MVTWVKFQAAHSYFLRQPNRLIYRGRLREDGYCNLTFVVLGAATYPEQGIRPARRHSTGEKAFDRREGIRAARKASIVKERVARVDNGSMLPQRPTGGVG